MEIKKIMTMMAAALAIVIGVCSCGSDDDEPEVAVAAQGEGSYTGNEVIMVMGEESSNGTATYSIVKSSDVSVDMTIPSSGEGFMAIPAIQVKNIPLTKTGNTITGKLASFAGTVTNAQGQERAFTLSDVTVMVSDKTAVVKFSLKYGTMPFAMETTFTGTKK